jgi:hypothetical protein
MLITIAATSYNGFLARARASEAQLNLAAIYTAEQTFQAELFSFTSCLEATGYSPPYGGSYYAIGISSGSFNKCGPSGNKSCDGSGWFQGFQCATPTVGALGAPTASWWTASAAAGGNLAAGCANTTCSSVKSSDVPKGTVTNKAFTIYASGRVSENSNILDIWDINNSDVVTHVQSGF